MEFWQGKVAVSSWWGPKPSSHRSLSLSTVTAISTVTAECPRLAALPDQPLPLPQMSLGAVEVLAAVLKCPMLSTLLGSFYLFPLSPRGDGYHYPPYFIEEETGSEGWNRLFRARAWVLSWAGADLRGGQGGEGHCCRKSQLWQVFLAAACPAGLGRGLRCSSREEERKVMS